ncbi:DUF2399 domain-containing protein [Billgrantia sulfidoxydans]|uniref:DUF2399 domain-containing protein n=1 Tax=Billgrantia sulfidoxydans TaxID=2733484 RepID=A0ABX7W493_9GAMM|nr:DUF2399 domain-containing protein [Halomonas sulfidoxydans]QTP54686.1 DUF2399 domain-containing protein [Halomonas sulfidoxydans]
MRRMTASVQKAIRYQYQSVRVTKAWAQLHEELDVGTRVGNTLHLTERDRDVLALAFQREMGADLRTLDMQQDRIGMAGAVRDEKLSGKAALGSLQRVAMPGGAVAVKGEDGEVVRLPTPPGTVLSVETSRLALDPQACRRVMIIENGAVMDRWWDLLVLLPAEWCHETLFCYRGHDQAQGALNRWLKSLPEDVHLGYCGDYDAGGVSIAVNTYLPLVGSERFWLLVPGLHTAVPERANKPVTFLDQKPIFQSLDRDRRSGELSRLLERLREQQLAVTQEAIMAYGIPLGACRI